jgi:hypothetical protein
VLFEAVNIGSHAVHHRKDFREKRLKGFIRTGSGKTIPILKSVGEDGDEILAKSIRRT